MSSRAAAYTSLHNAEVEQHDHTDTTPFSTPLFRPSSRRNPSLSSSPSFSSNLSSHGSFSFPDDSPFSPSRTPLGRFSGVPFSWEQIPGKPKNGIPKKEELSTLSLLPLPPAGSCSSNSSLRKSSKEVLMDNMIDSPTKYYDPSESFRKDPFFAALVECSKDDHHHHHSKYWKGSSKVPEKTLSDRFGFINMYASCKRSCAVSESIVFLPRSRPYNLINRR